MKKKPSIPAAGDAWLRVEVDTAALRDNVAEFRRLVRRPTRLMPVVKADGYGHGVELAARAFLAGGADWLGVHSVAEAVRLREAGIEVPVLVLGPVTSAEAALAADLDCDLTVGSLAGLAAVTAVGRGRIHLKVETGVNRQGVVEEELDEVRAYLAAAPEVRLVGMSSHFADIEDTTDHTFANRQRERFDAWSAALAAAGHRDLIRHMTCSAATLLWPDAHRDMVRVGISAYGLWPSRETLVAARAAGRADLVLR